MYISKYVKSNIISLVLLAVCILLLFSQPYYFKLYFQPIKYREIISKEAETSSVDSDLLAALIFVESGFNSDALSSRGAVGLMQIMPETAGWIAEQKDLENFVVSDLYNPKINIEFGSWYFAHLLEKFDNKLNLALAAYNAGQGNVSKWIESGWDGKMGEEYSVPFEETDDFIRKVLKTRSFYQKFNKIK
ncbi:MULTISPECIES: lytic transglycosylase domain-containing protein [unclassified Halanaerobium]|uniref:lytic transglycosylase domain-containing protein n=1 Tax=unclassified Halanaerobium TaxID=2641197 RepID=UPI000DF1AA01|nr:MULTISPECIES: lytic transglycosylase domain-containing protein [unclassified Halanaerobium]RCW48778.1 soluble lytic murein transglycosylase [Halanaerobium sp. MA284_MarDTE_T2]RCW89120.1 soluble lytic murein transglycosylase [Halanaerobium sp. DL-01]